MGFVVGKNAGASRTRRADWLDLHRAAPTDEGLWVSYEVGVKTVVPNSLLLMLVLISIGSDSDPARIPCRSNSRQIALSRSCLKRRRER
jgi:hypothetical protein